MINEKKNGNFDYDFVIGYKKMKLTENALKNPKLIKQGDEGLVKIIIILIDSY